MAKYKFVKGNNETIVWDVKKGKRLCRFDKGLYETDDLAIAKTLRNLGYKEMKDYPHGPPEGGFIPKKTKLLPPKRELSPGGPAIPDSRPDMDVEDEEVVETVIDQKATKSTKAKAKTLKRRSTKK